MSPRLRRIALTLALLALGAGVASALSDEGLERLARLDRELALAQGQIEALSAENRRLRLEIEALKSDDAYLESVARDDLGLVRPGDRVYRFERAAGGAR